MKNRKAAQAAVMAVLTIIPAFYAYIYLYACWDPAAKLSNVPVAVVNEDKGAVINGDEKNIGNSLVSELSSEKKVKWIFTDKKTGNKGVRNGDYYGELIIPEDFTGSIATATKKNKKQGILYFRSDDKLGTTASSMTADISEEIENRVSESVTRSLTDDLSGRVQSLPDDLQKLSDALTVMKSGTEKLNSSMTVLTAGQSAFSGGLNSFADGMKDSSQGGQQINDALLHLSAAAAGTPFSAKITQISDGTASLSSGIDSLSLGADTLSEKSQVLFLADKKILAGISKLDSGTEKIRTELDDSIKELRNSDSILDSFGKYAADPVTMKTEKIGEAENTGTAMAPFILSLCLWLGGLILIIVFTTMEKIRFRESSLTEKFMIDIGLFRFQLLAVLQAVLLAFTAVDLLGLNVSDTFRFYGICILSALAFTTLIQIMVLLFHDAGKLLAVIFMLLQLTAGGGIMPMDLVPPFYRNIHPFMPMTYSIEALRNNIFSMNAFQYRHCMLVLALTLAAGLLLVMLLSFLTHLIRQQKRNVLTHLKEDR